MKNKTKCIILLILIVSLISFLTYNIYMDKKDNQKEENNKIANNNTTTTSTTTTTTTKTTTTSTSTTTTKVTTKATTTTKKVDQSDKFVSSKGYKITYENGAYYVDGYLIANKTYALSSDWKPQNTFKSVPNSGFAREPLNKEAYDAWLLMKNDASALNLNLWAQSGYRSYDYQKELYENYVSRKGKAAADKSSARPGHSEHQSGLAFDLNTITTSFKDTAEGKWVANNAYLYGYIIRYPENKTNETGYIFEPWHIRYVGKELAKALYNGGDWITMESYFGITSKYDD